MKSTDVKHVHKSIVILLAMVCSLLGTAWADEAFIFGPETFTRTKGKPVTHERTFSAGGQCASGILHITNGNWTDKKETRVSSAVIALNDTLVVLPSQLNTQVTSIRNTVELAPENTLNITLMSKPGSMMTVSLSCDLTPVTVPNVYASPRADAEMLIQNAGLAVGEMFEMYRATVPSGLVIGQDPIPGTPVPPGSPVALLVVKEPPAGEGEMLPGTWQGTWDMTIKYYNVTTNGLVVLEEVSGGICSGDPVGGLLLETMLGERSDVNEAACSGTASESSMDVSCSAEATVDGCAAEGALQFQVSLSGETFTGKGSWALEHSCPLSLPAQGQSFTLLATRSSTDPGIQCSEPVSSFFQKFMKHPLLPVAERLQ